MDFITGLVFLPSLFGVEPETETVELDVKGMKNSQDATRIKGELERNPGILSAECDHGDDICLVAIDPLKIKEEEVAVKINQMGYQAYLKSPAEK